MKNYGRKIVRDKFGRVIRVGIVSLPNEEDLKKAREQLGSMTSVIAKLNSNVKGT